MKIVNIVIASLAVLLSGSANAALVEFEFSGIFDAPNGFAPVGTAYSGKFGYDSAILPSSSFIENDPAVAVLSYAQFTDPSIFIETTINGVTYHRDATAAISNSEMDGFVFWVGSTGPDEYISINFDETMVFDLNRLELPMSFAALGVRPDPLNDWEGQHAPSGEFDFYDVGTGKSVNAAISSISPASSGVGGAVSAVPEPESWALMISGFGLVGAAMRRRRGELAVAC